ncbi:hypothetical protein [Gordonibacter urolithinfaciens]|uniref:hypothetical protein n=1 Tax=Gordonibacter urolithinfaciens TaxID=1335613 RepID=UPI003A95A4FE
MNSRAHWTVLGECFGGRWRVWRFDEPLDMRDALGRRHVTRDVVVSDAHTHVERLVFPVMAKRREERDGRLSEVVGYPAGYVPVEVEGTATLMVDGGDPSTVEPDEAYLARLWARWSEEEAGHD